jgi:hypothetical protein
METGRSTGCHVIMPSFPPILTNHILPRGDFPCTIGSDNWERISNLESANTQWQGGTWQNLAQKGCLFLWRYK